MPRFFDSFIAVALFPVYYGKDLCFIREIRLFASFAMSCVAAASYGLHSSEYVIKPQKNRLMDL
jgi:hypothetical protein